MSVTAATWWAEYLRTRGVSFAFGPGGAEATTHLDALGRAGIEHVRTHGDSAAVFAAATLGELTAVPGLCVLPLGQSLADTLAAVRHARLGRVPLLVVTAGESPSGESAPGKADPPTEAFRPAVKRSLLLTADNIHEELPAAFDLATTDPLGPVHLAFPPSEARREVACDSLNLSASNLSSSETDDQGETGPVGVARATRLVAAARRPLFYVGLGARELEAERLLLSLAERLGAPVVVTPKAKGHFPADHPLFAGVYPARHSEPVMELFRQSDLVVGIGLDQVELPSPWPFEAPVVAYGPVDASPCFPDCLDVRVTSYPALAAALRGLAATAVWPTGAAAEARRQILRAVDSRQPAVDSGLRGSASASYTVVSVLRQLRRLLRRDAILACDFGPNSDLSAQLWPSYWPRTFLTGVDASSAGFGLPAALAAKLVCLDREVACVVEDAAPRAWVAELETLARIGLRVLVVAFASASRSPIGKEDASLAKVNAGSAARDLGVWSASVVSSDQIERTLVAALARAGPALVQVQMEMKR